MGFKWCDTQNNCSCKDNNEFEIKLKCMKTKLHSIYIASISAGIVIWALATGDANSDEFSAWISFASTITSIILSVIAIIMSISGENKTELMRDKMEEASKKMEKSSKEVEQVNKDTVDSIKELKKEMDELKEVLRNIPKATADKIQAECLSSIVEAKSVQKAGKGWLENDGQ